MKPKKVTHENKVLSKVPLSVGCSTIEHAITSSLLELLAQSLYFVTCSS